MNKKKKKKSTFLDKLENLVKLLKNHEEIWSVNLLRF